MTIEQTVEIPDNHRITLDIPPEFPPGRAILTFASVLAPDAVTAAEAEARDIELINRNAERLNQEALDVLSFQTLEI
ncbi:MAG: hypothetical protein LBK08_14205 [Treponema sp.]|jgi:hypothetical protein|nr:hypothetical protein [Treponema sp.]